MPSKPTLTKYLGNAYVCLKFENAVAAPPKNNTNKFVCLNLDSRLSIILFFVAFNTEQRMYWASQSTSKQAVEMAYLNGIGRVTLLSESKANYRGITLYKDCLYISDDTRRYTF